MKFVPFYFGTKNLVQNGADEMRKAVGRILPPFVPDVPQGITPFE